MTETQNQAQNLSPKDKIKEEILGKHRVTRVLPRTQMELREQEDSLASLSLDISLKHVLDELESTATSEQKAKINEIRQKYSISK